MSHASKAGVQASGEASSQPDLLSFGLLAFNAVVWGSAFFLIDIALDGFRPITLAFTRIAIGAVLLGIIAVWCAESGRRHLFHGFRGQWPTLIVASATGTALPFALVSWGQTHLPSSVAATIMATSPLFTMALARIWTKDERMTRRKLGGFLLAFLGIAIMSIGQQLTDPGIDSLLAGVAFLAAAIGYAVSAVAIRQLNDIPPMRLSANLLLISAVAIAPFAFLFEAPLASNPSAIAIGAIVTLGILPSGIAVLAMVFLIKRAGASFAITVNYLVPPVGVSLGVLALNEPLNWQLLLAALLILSGLFLAYGRLGRTKTGQ
ncbi:MAG: EamA family transporter [Pseudomonadota bacterium]